MFHDSLLGYEQTFKEQTYPEKKRYHTSSSPEFSSAVPQMMLSIAKKASENTAYNDTDFNAEKISWIKWILIYFH